MGRLRAGGRHVASLGMSTQIDEGQWTPSHWGGMLGVHHARSPPVPGGPCEVSLGCIPQSPSQSSFLSLSPCGAGTDTEHKQTWASL